MPVDGHGRIIALSMACRAHQRPLLTQNTLFHGGNTGSNPVGDAIETRARQNASLSADTLGFSSLRWYRTGVQDVSAMTYLWRHQSGVYYFRRAVPDDIRAIIGKTMVKQSLGTKDVAEAKRRAHPIAIQTDADFRSARERR